VNRYREHFLADLVAQYDLRHAVELGVWKGRTFLHLLVHCPHLRVTGVDAWTPRPQNEGIEGGETYERWDMAGLEQYVRERAEPFGDRAQILKMDTVEAAAQFEDNSIDLLFIDADHSTEGVTRDIKAWAPKVRSRGFITGHDIDWPTVRAVVEKRFPKYQTGPDNVWWIRK
jgi:predicted O-methyltransferase YrrM